jgi:hypothetical protein
MGGAGRTFCFLPFVFEYVNVCASFVLCLVWSTYSVGMTDIKSGINQSIIYSALTLRYAPSGIGASWYPEPKKNKLSSLRAPITLVFGNLPRPHLISHFFGFGLSTFVSPTILHPALHILLTTPHSLTYSLAMA